MYSVLKTKQKRSETCWQCEKCEVPLHIPKCFKEYHTETSFYVSTYIQYTVLKIKKKIFSTLLFINIFVWTYIFMQWTDLVGHLNLSALFTHRVFKSELIGLSNLSSLQVELFVLSNPMMNSITYYYPLLIMLEVYQNAGTMQSPKYSFHLTYIILPSLNVPCLLTVNSEFWMSFYACFSV
jgi:hypothetical protein